MTHLLGSGEQFRMTYKFLSADLLGMMGHMNPTGATDREVLRGVGERLRAAREGQGLTMVETAARTGLARRTVQRAEAGDNPTLLTVVRLLRLYGRLDAFEGFVAPPEVSPMALLKTAPPKKGARGG